MRNKREFEGLSEGIPFPWNAHKQIGIGQIGIGIRRALFESSRQTLALCCIDFIPLALSPATQEKKDA